LRNILEKPNIFDQYAVPITLGFIALIVPLIVTIQGRNY
jgi:hypothetical protein